MNWLASGGIRLLKGYKRFISPLLPPACRYVPTCSEYGMEALRLHGVIKGGWLTTRRLCRCHPWGGHGWDPVPGSAPLVPPLPSSSPDQPRDPS